MFRQTIISALRSFKKSALMNYLNIIGLTFGLSVFFLISLFLYQEQTYERDFSQRENIYQVSTVYSGLGEVAWTPTNLEHVIDQVPSVKMYTAFENRTGSKAYVENNEFIGLRVLHSDSSFFKVFDFELISGTAETVLNKPNSIVINEQVATRMFGKTDVVGEIIYLNKEQPLIITGVSRAPHFKTQLNFDLVVSKTYSAGIENELWSSIGSYMYLVVNDNTRPEDLDRQLTAISEEYIYPLVKDAIVNASSFEEWKNQESYLGFFAEQLLELRTASDSKNLMTPILNKTLFDTLMIIGIATLLISVINFINISTAKASVRIGEVAVKRILGSSRTLLIAQFLLEAFLIIVVSSLLSLGIVETVVQLSPDYLAGMIGYSVTHSTEWILGMVLFVVGLTLISGLYPALYLSSGKTLSMLKASSLRDSFNVLNASLMRKGATVIQFVLSISLIAGVITMFSQLDHLGERDLGYESADVFVIRNAYKLGDGRSAFVQALDQTPSVANAASANHFPNQSEIEVLSLPIESADGRKHPFIQYRADPSFFDVMGMTFTAGGPFDQPIDNSEPIEGSTVYYPVVINEVAVRALGLEEPIGSIIDDDRKVVGVVNDFVFSDLRQSISPTIIGQRSNRHHFQMAVKMAPGNFDIGHVENVWSKFTDDKLVWHKFSSNYDKLLKKEEETFKSILTFSFVAIIISCLGLFGLVVFTTEQRVKEFSIRKVLGANIIDIARLFSWDFLKLVLVSFLVAIPLSAYGLTLWLNDFSDRIPLSISIFLVTGAITLLIVFSTIGFQLLKTGRLNPVDTLRNE